MPTQSFLTKVNAFSALVICLGLAIATLARGQSFAGTRSSTSAERSSPQNQRLSRRIERSASRVLGQSKRLLRATGRRLMPSVLRAATLAANGVQIERWNLAVGLWARRYEPSGKALGVFAIAQGEGSRAVGLVANAKGDNARAVGLIGIAEGLSSTAIGGAISFVEDSPEGAAWSPLFAFADGDGAKARGGLFASSGAPHRLSPRADAASLLIASARATRSRARAGLLATASDYNHDGAAGQVAEAKAGLFAAARSAGDARARGVLSVEVDKNLRVQALGR